MEKAALIVNIVIIACLILVVVFMIGLQVGGHFDNNFTYINTEPSRTGSTNYTLIYLYKNEIRYLYYDDPYTETAFMRITGMIDEAKN